MTIIRALLAGATVLAGLSAPAALAQTLSAQESAKVDQIVTQALGKSGVPSASVAIVRDGKIAFAKAYGKQAPDIPAPRSDAKYQIASISKQFTAAAVLLLEDQGKLSLDDTVSKYIPGITQGDRITIRQLLSHTSGLQDYWPQDYSFAAMEKPVTPQEIVDRWAKKPLDFQPGTQWQYSNTGYVVAGMIVEKVAGQPLLSFLEKNIFQPLDIDAIDQDKAIGKGFPTPYHRYALGPVRPEKPAAPGWLYAAGELAMSASDLAKWDIARMNRALLPADDWKAQETPVKLTDGSSTGYGLGVDVGTMNGHDYVEHSGEAVGFLSENYVFNKDKDAVVVLVNADFGRTTGEIAHGIADQILFPGTSQDEADTAALAKARTIYGQLRSGTLDRKLLTEDANYYFTPTALQDYRQSLSQLGEPQDFAQTGKTRLRGGFVNRNYVITYPSRKLLLVTYAEPAEQGGRLEQYIVMPVGD